MTNRNSRATRAGALPLSRDADTSRAYLRDVVAEVLANNGYYPTDKAIYDLVEMMVVFGIDALERTGMVNRKIIDKLRQMESVSIYLNSGIGGEE